MKPKLDQFYTNPLIAQECLNSIQECYEYYIEPSAGNGSFFNLLPKDKRIGIDLEPRCKGVEQADFFKWLPKISINKEKTLVIGNPPFGKRSRLALQFFLRASVIANTIAFVFPKQFRKWSVQKHIPKTWRLVIDKTLPEKNTFMFPNGKPYSVNGCCFQVWTCNPNNKNLRIKEKPIISHPDFDMYLYNNTRQAEKFFDYKWDFAVPRQGYYDYSIRETDKNKCSKKIQWVFFKASNKEVLNRLININFECLAKKNTTIPGWGKADIVEEYQKLLNPVE